MWMVESNDHHHNKELKNIPTKLRPLMPRPNSKINITTTPYSSNPSCSCIRNPNILQWTHPISGLSDYGVRREVQSLPLVSTRWNPTPEQLQSLEEMYRRGIRTPSAEQIQQIASKLRRFGKIEGKNVFYWFQNHKARERQKKRRQLELQLAANKIHHSSHNDRTLDSKQTPGLSRRYIEIEHHKKLPTEDCVLSMQAPVIAAEWTQLHHKILTAENEFVHLSSALSPSLNAPTAHKPTVPKYTDDNQDDDAKENRATTLQLFPIHDESGGSTIPPREDDDGSCRRVREVGVKFGPSDFIEFLPTKN